MKLLAGLVVLAACAHALENAAYRVQAGRDAALEITAKGAGSYRFLPDFVVLYRESDPGLRSLRAQQEAYVVPAWKSVRDGQPTMDLFQAAKAIPVRAGKAETRGREIVWVFPEHEQFRLEAQVSLPETGEPRVDFQFTPRQPGWYSIAYAGVPETRAAEIEAIWQPLVWQERRFPRLSFLSMEHMCSIPAALTTSGGLTVGVAADPAEVPFRLPTFANSRFGVLVRNANGNAQPMVFAPALGGAGSRMRPGCSFEFRSRLLVTRGEWFQAFRRLSSLYGFHDYRENATCSLNETLDNMVAFEMDDAYSGWIEDLKAFDYTTDVAGSVKLVSSLHPLSVALVRDDPEIYRRRALPMIEYMMSREKYLFSLRPDIKGQSASHFLRGPCAEVSELAALFSMTLGRTTVFRRYAEELYGKPRVLNLDMVSKGKSWQNALALYRLTGEPKYLDEARAGADRYIAARIDRPQEDFSDVHVDLGGQFWTDFAPKWIDLIELYEETRQPRYLRAARIGAELYATYMWMSPPVPNGSVTVNPGGEVGIYMRPRGVPDLQPMQAPEQKVPAWRVSQIGLTPEASTTYTGNPAVMLTHYAAYLLRLARYTGDSWFSDLARSAVVGRYASFPGYDINGEFTTIYQRPDYPLRPWAQLTYNNIYYNHVWPHIALLMDYLVSDAFARSEAKIDFPPRYAQGYAYLQSKVYGDRPGNFYGDHGVRLWMPAKLLRTGGVQLNYLAGYGNGKFYLAFLNQSPREVDTKVVLNPDLVPLDVRRNYPIRVWRQNQAAPPATLQDGTVAVKVGPKGITALAIDGLVVAPRLQQQFFDERAPKLSERSFLQSATPLGKLTGMLITMGRRLTSAYIWLAATEVELKEARLHYRSGEEWKEAGDNRYPFEFSLPLRDGQSFEFWIEGVKPDGEKVRTGPLELMP